MNYTYNIYELSTEFYKHYNSDFFPEILRKKERPYSVFLLKYSNEIMIAIPFRTNIKHSNGYIFSTNSHGENSGLDYSKLAIIKNKNYIGSLAIVDSNEFKELTKKSNIIIKQVITYVTNYCNHVKGLKFISKESFLENMDIVH
ncbi:hypothetical protein P5008_04820 [Helcococcus ovis]